tara:strand:+ start:2243 stop:2668 length:426 start_codon:yes stop_codon:yes gene_type:complete
MNLSQIKQEKNKYERKVKNMYGRKMSRIGTSTLPMLSSLLQFISKGVVSIMSQSNRIRKPRERWTNNLLGADCITVSKGTGGVTKKRFYSVRNRYGSTRYEFSKSVTPKEIEDWIELTLTRYTEKPFSALENRIDALVEEE